MKITTRRTNDSTTHLVRRMAAGPVTRTLLAFGVGAVTAVTMTALPLGSAIEAGAAPVSAADFTCGVTVFTACNESAHSTDLTQVGSPLGSTSSSCPSWLANDYVGIVGTGNGVEHAIINKAGDGWFTSTQTGLVTITAYPESSMDLSNPDNPVIDGPADPAVPSYTGHLTQWFGGAFNNQNQVFGGTGNFSGTAADGTTLSLHFAGHMNTIPNQVGPPHMFQIANC